MTIPFVGPSYDLKRRKADVQRSVNLMPTKVENASGKNAMFLKSVPGLTVLSEPVASCLGTILETFSSNGNLNNKNADIAPAGWSWHWDDPFYYTADLTVAGGRVTSNLDGYSNPYGPVSGYATARLSSNADTSLEEYITLSFPYEFATTVMHDWNSEYEYPAYSNNSTNTLVKLDSGTLANIYLSLDRYQIAPYPPGTQQTKAFVSFTNSTNHSAATEVILPSNGDPVRMRVVVNENDYVLYVNGSASVPVTLTGGCPNTFRRIKVQLAAQPSWISYIEVSECPDGITNTHGLDYGVGSTSGNLNLSWEAQTATVEYRIYFSTSATVPGVGAFKVRLPETATSYTVLGLTPGVWYWWIGKVNVIGENDWFLWDATVVT